MNTFRANIYSLEKLPDDTRQEIHTGIDMVAAYIGHEAVKRHCRLKVPTDLFGHVDPRKVGLGKLDKMVELHMMAVPLSLSIETERVGLAMLGDGVSFVDTSEFRQGFPGRTAVVTAHETAHAFGFVDDHSEHADPGSHAHCSDPNCIMHYQVIERVVAEPQAKNPLIRGAKAVMALFGKQPEPKVGYQYDFCTACKIDLHHTGHHKLNDLRARRLFNGI